MGYVTFFFGMIACVLLIPIPTLCVCSIKQLTKLLSEFAPASVKEQTLADLNGRKIAIDASMAIYQFLVCANMFSQSCKFM